MCETFCHSILSVEDCFRSKTSIVRSPEVFIAHPSKESVALSSMPGRSTQDAAAVGPRARGAGPRQAGPLAKKHT